jgi:hypothetical protein
MHLLQRARLLGNEHLTINQTKNSKVMATHDDNCLSSLETPQGNPRESSKLERPRRDGVKRLESWASLQTGLDDMHLVPPSKIMGKHGSCPGAKHAITTAMDI